MTETSLLVYGNLGYDMLLNEDERVRAKNSSWFIRGLQRSI